MEGCTPWIGTTMVSLYTRENSHRDIQKAAQVFTPWIAPGWNWHRPIHGASAVSQSIHTQQMLLHVYTSALESRPPGPASVFCPHLPGWFFEQLVYPSCDQSHISQRPKQTAGPGPSSSSVHDPGTQADAELKTDRLQSESN